MKKYQTLSNVEIMEIAQNNENLKVKDFVKKFNSSHRNIVNYYNIVKLSKPELSFLCLLFFLGFSDYEIRDEFTIGKKKLKLKDIRYYRRNKKIKPSNKGVLFFTDKKFFVFTPKTCNVYDACLPKGFDINSVFVSGVDLSFDIDWNLFDVSFYFLIFSNYISKKFPSARIDNLTDEEHEIGRNPKVENVVPTKIVVKSVPKLKSFVRSSSDNEERNILIEGTNVKMTQSEFNVFSVNRSHALFNDDFDWEGKIFCNYKPRNSFFCVEFCRIVDLLEKEFWGDVYQINVPKLMDKGHFLLAEKINCLEADFPVKKFLLFLSEKFFGDLSNFFKYNKNARLNGRKIVHELRGEEEYLDVDYEWKEKFLNKKFEKIDENSQKEE